MEEKGPLKKQDNLQDIPLGLSAAVKGIPVNHFPLEEDKD